MSQHDAAQHDEHKPVENKRSPEASDGEPAAENDESFEDAVDTVDSVSVRSLTKRAVSTSKPPPTEEHHPQPQAPETASDRPQHPETASEPPQQAEPEVAQEADAKSHRESSPLSRRLSSTSNLDNVNLDDEAAPSVDRESKASVENEQPPKTLSLSSITSALPSMPWSPPAGTSPAKSPGASSITTAPPSTTAATQPPPPTRKLTGAFSWLSRNSSGKDAVPAQQPSQRRNTASSVGTLTSNPEMMLGKLEEETENGKKEARMSLKDRFKLLRLQQEAGIPPHALEDDNGSSGAGLGLVNGDAASITSELASPAPVPTPTIDLAPGTVSGVNAGPSAMPESQVDWDLWQSVVYEGPAVVARTSAEELNRAITTGIPSAIRGVIWQVLAQSKNPELEAVYKDLVVRGTDKEKRHSNSTTASASSSGNITQSGEAVTSSASSVKSDRSGTNASMSSKAEKVSEPSPKAQAVAAAERKKREKEETAALQKLEKTIRRDLGARTSYSKYAASAGLQDGLFGVCKAYALYDEGVGYAQGMNFLIMPLLFNMPEEEAFCLLVRLMHNYDLRELFIQDMPGLHMRLYQFERLLEDVEPALYCHLKRRGISPHLYATQWFLTLFAYRFPLQLVLRIYDLILSEGLSAILRFGIVLMQKNASLLLAISDMQQLTTHLKDKVFDVYIDKDPSAGSLLENGFFGSSSASMDKEVYRADQLVKDASEVKLTPETLKMYTAEWEEKTKAEKDRETELQDLKISNQSYAIQLRKLEERVEACDREQADLATELVHTKVENEELKDENESLKGQVQELRVVIEKQPMEIEEAWKLERDSLMKRNENVHEENRKLEQELAELEEVLVKTKMQYAEINSQHETLNRKWSDLKRQFA
ncbi:GTPase activating protein (Gyp5) [Cordyceps fumosorosea ARSEF 2679]|uniref:GTPase-activating protein GYP5 n=1 Tax=Cordyceps fumosorosea (strain ARSEF 2679) TaxID=1081104 RepID=A0A167MXQ6_CORFA|nr:GTPase activating protein (Gyp5) [Cordyceps fumosorosea ARSEF 2679]OAA54877.1 GTPase activating protein (Gyp5) [Cordyceps fumosorosea ARSEF 2679]